MHMYLQMNPHQRGKTTKSPWQVESDNMSARMTRLAQRYTQEHTPQLSFSLFIYLSVQGIDRVIEDRQVMKPSESLAFAGPGLDDLFYDLSRIFVYWCARRFGDARVMNCEQA